MHRPVARTATCRQPGARATLATVAASAGVSVATVSKVLNGRSDVAPATRALVQTLLAASTTTSGAAPSAAGRRRRRRSSCVFDGELNAYSTEIMQGVLDAAAELGRRGRR